MLLPAQDKNESYWFLILALLIFFSLYFALGAYPLFDNNEGLYASIAKLMLLHKEFIIPHLNCVPYIEKPPLLYWLLSGSFSLFGFTTLAARLVTATSAALICVAMVAFAKKIRLPQVGIMGALIFTSSLGVSIIARMVYFDMLFTLFISGALFGLFSWYESQKISRLRIGYIFLGLAILTKGLVAIVLIWGSLILFLALERNFRAMYRALDPLGITLFLLVVLPWHLAAVIKHKDFFWHYIIEEHFLRFLNQREPHDYYHGPIYYYLPRIMIYLFPWSFFMPLIFWRKKNPSASEKKLLLFSWCWLLVPLWFFSLSGAKANYYMIVSVPALAIILGIKIRDLSLLHPRIFSRVNTGIFFIIAITMGCAGSALFPKPAVVITVVYCLIAGMAALLLAKHPQAIIVMFAALIIPLVITMVAYIKANQHELSTAEAGTYLAMEARGPERYVYQEVESISALLFYAPGCLKVIDSQSNDLYYGQSLSQFRTWFVTKEELLRDGLKRQTLVVVPSRKLEQFYREMQPIRFSSPLKRLRRAVVVGGG